MIVFYNTDNQDYWAKAYYVFPKRSFSYALPPVMPHTSHLNDDDERRASKVRKVFM